MARVTTTSAPLRPVPSGAVLVAAFAISVVAIFNINIPYYAVTPGPTQNVLQLIEIDGAKTATTTGSLLLTTVSLRPIRVAEAIRGWIDARYEILSRAALVQPGDTDEDAERRTAAQMEESHQYASAAALKLLGYKVVTSSVGALVTDIATDVPAKDVLRRGDLIVAADAVDVTRTEDFQAAVRKLAPGEEIVLKVVRGDERLTVKTRTFGLPEDPSSPVIGVFLDTAVRVKSLPLAIDIESLNIGGPSAGLMYALGIVEMLDTSDLTAERTIAGTGEIDVDGTVGAVGGINQKVESAIDARADLFLVPQSELAEACERAGNMKVVGVEHLRDAVRALRDPKIAASRSCP